MRGPRQWISYGNLILESLLLDFIKAPILIKTQGIGFFLFYFGTFLRVASLFKYR
ncbi:hypothetical protein LEP1GSC171_3888 [Leptospira santarosai str. HAI1380]|uniref:Uncharacterized protein n=1 Tax=Leptospira santarosai serovar Shermani str. LT 821 TaxID=758847 RepID=A0A097ESB9_9LEPT|nr:hypothetical protein LSS_21070 [Leptospira santarosai serovar Shermani str. LT 821]EMO72257.1 hypothetical protein LEP1GSC130_0234 [Leptospira santarosai str. 200403458]EMO86297.1 hypothetical protein LEP1GSC070_2833 [Leptospira santarosai str. AIM]EMO98845.1 hypothetical protein LEP1GSC120_1420 [Leptospira santarosai str. 200702252]EMP01191.1 hypothetical protein LEP1GSC171_3888 [Leptospira santarosai str. HAI1380]EPG83351.1 hypothetical protein LEP1GSC048_2740 [Leptospira santarosai serov